MNDSLGILLALLAVVVPLLLAGRLLAPAPVRGLTPPAD